MHGVIPDQDLWRITHTGSDAPYRVLGAHEAERDGKRGFLFAVWAPNARRVSVVGDFNQWDGRANIMRDRGDSGVWELFIPDLK
jgi:1,4-alpha-glucan branching enzyme